MKRLTLFALAGSLAVASAHASTSPTKYVGHELSGQAKITLTQARAAALKARPGKIVDQELEKESGGSGLRYSFDVRSHGKTVEVGIDAETGKVLENAAENPVKEAREAAQEHARH
jgi:uncharacterized membrane protein YkoI